MNAYLGLSIAGKLQGMLVGKVTSLSGKGVTGALDKTSVVLTDEFPLEIDRHYSRID